jgi:hypothetical protein
VSFIAPLVPLVLSAATIAEGAAPDTPIGTFQNVSAGGKLRLIDSAGSRVKLVGTELKVNRLEVLPDQVKKFSIIVEEWNPDAQTPRQQTELKITITAASLPGASSKPTLTAPSSPRVGDLVSAIDANITGGVRAGGRWVRAGTDGYTVISYPDVTDYRFSREDRGYRIGYQTIGRNKKGELLASSDLTGVVLGSLEVTPPIPANPTLSISDPIELPEGNSGTTSFVYTVTLKRNGFVGPAPFTWAVTPGATNPISADDVVQMTGADLFAENESVKTVTVKAIGETKVEPNESFIITVFVPGIGTVTSAGTILNDDDATLTVPLGANTRRGMGAFDLGYTGSGTPAIVAGDTGGLFTIVNKKLVLAGTAGAAPPALAASYTLRVSDGAGWAVTASVVTVNNARHVATMAELAAHGAALGETVILRDGNYASQGTGGPRIAAPTGTFSGSNHAVLTADNVYKATISNVFLAGGFALRGLRWTSLLSGAGIECLRLTGDNYIIENNHFEVDDSTTYSYGIFKNGAIQNVTIRANTFKNLATNIAMGTNGTQSNNILVDANTFINMGEDGMQFANAGSVTVTNNLVIDKLTPVGSQAHPDFVQVNTLSTTTTTGPVLGDLIVRGNMIIRGNGGDGGYAGLHGVFAGPWNAAGPTYQNIYIENNCFQTSNANSISMVVKDASGNVAGAIGVNIYVRNNTAINDPSALDLIDPTLAGSIPAINVTGMFGDLVVTGNVCAGPITATVAGAAKLTNQGNLANMKAFTDHQAIFANPYATGSGNSGLTDIAARKADYIARYATKGAAANIGAFVPTTPVATMTPYTLLDGFDTLGSRTVTGGAAQQLVAPVVLGAGAMQLKMQGVTNPTLTNPNIGVDEDPASWDLIGYCVDVGTDSLNNSVSGLNLRITTNGQTYLHVVDTSLGLLPNTDFFPIQRGKRWLTYKASRLRAGGAVSGSPLTAAGAGAKQVAIQMLNANTNKNATVKVDALVRPQRVKPAIVITFDDVNDGQFYKAAPVMKAAGIAAGMPYPFVGTGFLCSALLDTSGKLTTAQALSMRNDYGWSWSLDSGPYDEALTEFPTRAAAIAQLNALRDFAIKNGFSSVEDAKLFCWSYGAGTYWGGGNAPLHSQSITPNGTDTITVSNTLVSVGLAAGMVVKNTGANGNPVLVEVRRGGNSSINLIFDRPIPAGAARTFYFCASRRGVAYTSTGGAQLTNIDTTFLVPGMTMYAYNVPEGLTILSVDVEGATGTVTMSGNVPSGTAVANFHLKDAEFQISKIEDDLLANGYTFGRMGSAGGGNGVYTGYGLDPLFGIRCPAASFDDGTAAGGSTAAVDKAYNEVMEAIENGRDLICYMHYGPGQNHDNFAALMQRLAVGCASGAFDILTLGAWKARVDRRLPIA